MKPLSSILITAFLLFSSFLFSQNPPSQPNKKIEDDLEQVLKESSSAPTVQNSNSAAEKESATTLKSSNEKKEEAIYLSDEEKLKIEQEELAQLFKWGLDSQIKIKLTDLISKKNDAFAPQVIELYLANTTKSYVPLIFDYFNEIEDYSLTGAASDLVRYYANESDEVISRILDYLVNAKKANKLNDVPDLNEIVWNLYQNGNDIVSQKALMTLANIEASEYIDNVKNAYEDPYLESKLKPQMLKTIGALSDKNSLDWFVSLLQQELPKAEKQAACEVIAKSGNDSYYSLVSSFYEEGDPFLRLAITENLGDFSRENLENFILLALKDDYWRVRNVATNLVEKHNFSSLVPILIFKVKTEPEEVLKKEAIKVLGTIQTQEANQFLLDTILENRFSLAIKKELVNSLFKYEPATFGTKLFNWTIEEDKKGNSLVTHIADCVYKNASENLAPFIEYFISSNISANQYSAVLAMSKIGKAYNQGRLEFLLKRNKKNYLGTAIIKLFEELSIPIPEEVTKEKK